MFRKRSIYFCFIKKIIEGFENYDFHLPAGGLKQPERLNRSTIFWPRKLDKFFEIS
jgi:hypothetical protein